MQDTATVKNVMLYKPAGNCRQGRLKSRRMDQVDVRRAEISNRMAKAKDIGGRKTFLVEARVRRF